MELLLLIKVKGMKFPLDRKYYTKDGAHLWLKFEGDFIKVGMDAFVAEMMGSIAVLIVDKKIAKSGEVIGSFESAKYISKLNSPVSGEIIDVNDYVLRNPCEINKNPYDSWIFRIKPDNIEDECMYIIEGEDDILRWISEEIKRVEGES